MGRGNKSWQQTVWVRFPHGRYPALVRAGILETIGQTLRKLRHNTSQVLVVSSPPVWRRWGKRFLHGLGKGGVHPGVLFMDDGESSKRLSTVERLAEQMIRMGADRDTFLLAFGGGVVGDTAGFLAATYMRGIPYAQVPTTLVAQADSSIGGKTGVNLRSGKNLLGAFYRPTVVFTDPKVLSTLPDREYRAGLYEVAKCAILGDSYLFRYLENHMTDVRRREATALRTILLRCIRLKARIVAEDEREGGVRRLLNLGHTFGHAFESLGNYKLLRHGEAVGWGLLAATRLSRLTGRLSGTDADRITQLVLSVGTLPRLPVWPPTKIYGRLFADKKRKDGQLYFVLPRGPGRAETVGGVPRRTILDSLSQLTRMR